MSTGSSARFADGYPADPATPLAVRALRSVALVAALARMWFNARFRVKRAGAEVRREIARSSALRLLDALAVEVVVRGRPPTARSGLLLVANHVSWLDSYALHAVADARFVGKSEIRGWPFIGAIAERFGTLFIVRGSRRDAWRTKNRAARVLRSGGSVAVFPEGTTTDGRRVRRFYPALFQSAVDAGVGIQPVAVRYYDCTGRPSTAAAFVGDMSIADSLAQILRERRLTVELLFGEPLDAGTDRKRLCRAAQTSVRELLALPRHWLIEAAADRERMRIDRAGRQLPAAAGA